MVTLFDGHPPGMVRNPEALFIGGRVDGERVGRCVVNTDGTIVMWDGEEYEWDGEYWHFARVVDRVIHDRLGYPIGG